MGNIGVALKRFLGNKNTVTIFGVILGVVVLYVFYNYRVNKEVEPVSIPCAKEEIPANTLITKDKLSFVKVSKNMIDITPNLIKNASQIIGKYVAYDTVIPAGALLYSSQFVPNEQRPNHMLENIEKCHTLYSLPVDLHSTYANSIMPNDYIDLYISAVSDQRKVIVTKLIESIKVLDVRDARGKPVFSSLSQEGDPKELLFSVPNDMFLLLRSADEISSNTIKIFPVPRNREYTQNATATQVTNAEMINFIYSKTDLSYSESTSLVDQECENLRNQSRLSE